MKTLGRRIFQVYYGATPIFMLLDLVWHRNIRTAGLESVPVLKFGYYAVCIGCGVVVMLKPALSAVISLTESSVNLVALVLGVIVPLYTTVPRAIDGVESYSPLTPFALVNFLLTGSILLVSIYSNPLSGYDGGAVKSSGS